MKPERDPQIQVDAERFDLLERPEHWPDDPAVQRQLAELLELHLALKAQGPSLPLASRPSPPFRPAPWILGLAATLAALVPSLYVVHHVRRLQAQATKRAHIEATARRRAEARLWASFFEQSGNLLARFHQRPAACDEDREDRNEERALALALLQVSRQLDLEGSPIPDAQNVRQELQAWLTELSLEDGCLTPERAEELRRLAQSQNLQEQTQALTQRLREVGS